jgi:hypothetical protein
LGLHQPVCQQSNPRPPFVGRQLGDLGRGSLTLGLNSRSLTSALQPGNALSQLRPEHCHLRDSRPERSKGTVPISPGEADTEAFVVAIRRCRARPLFELAHLYVRRRRGLSLYDHDVPLANELARQRMQPTVSEDALSMNPRGDGLKPFQARQQSRSHRAPGSAGNVAGRRVGSDANNSAFNASTWSRPRTASSSAIIWGRSSSVTRSNRRSNAVSKVIPVSRARHWASPASSASDLRLGHIRSRFSSLRMRIIQTPCASIRFMPASIPLQPVPVRLPVPRCLPIRWPWPSGPTRYRLPLPESRPGHSSPP